MGNSVKSILVLGGTGHYGKYIVKSLVNLDQPVRVLSRNPRKAKLMFDSEVSVVEGDITKIEDVKLVLNDIKAIIICISAFSRKTVKKIDQIENVAVKNVLYRAELLGIDRIIYISVYDIFVEFVKRFSIPQAKIKQEIEEFLKQSNFNWTVLGAAPSIEIFFSMIRGKTMNVPGGGPPALPTISPIDLGEICAQAVLRDDLAGTRFRLTGPCAYSFSEVARKISHITGKNIKYRKIPLIPLKILSAITKPFNPYLWHLLKFVHLLNNFPQELALEVGSDHNLLTQTFDYEPKTLEWHIKQWDRPKNE